MEKTNKLILKTFILTILFTLSCLVLSGCGINAKLILRVYNETNSSNSYGYEQTCIINFYGNNFTTKSSYLKINGNLTELKVVENTLNDFDEDEPISTTETHIYYDGTFKYTKQGTSYIKTTGTVEFNNDNKANFKENYLENVKLINLKEENKTLLKAKIKDENIKDVLNEENLSNAEFSILYNNKTKKVEQVELTYLSQNNNLVTIKTNYFIEAQSIILPM
ncbi:MAG: hypothetical protein E7359_00780 [Clostridiales bacterium]|nr:hypothetical protein [Clostridiales bacterium]